MKSFCFTIDDNIRFLKEVTAARPASLFDHPYPAMLRRLHERFGVKIQLNLFYRTEGFTLADMTNAYAREFAENADWLKLSFHSLEETDAPYRESDYGEVFSDAAAVHREILRFASEGCLARTTTVHCCYTREAGVAALRDLGVRGLLGLFGSDASPRVSYSIPEALAYRLRRGEILAEGGIAFASLDLVVNCYPLGELLPRLAAMMPRKTLRVMIHEQYFYGDYPRYQPDFEEKLATVLAYLASEGYENRFFEEMIETEVSV